MTTTIGEPILKPFVRRASLENSRWMGGHLFSFLVTGADTGGQFALMEVNLVAGQEPPPHTHAMDDEAFYVLEGAVGCRIGNETTVARPGEFVLLPRGVEHSFRVIGGSARVLLVSTPAGLEEAFMALSVPAAKMKVRSNAPAPDVGNFLREFGKRGITFRSPEKPPGPATSKPLAVRPTLGTSRWYLNHLITNLTTGSRTGGKLAVVEFSARQNPGPPLHTHTREDEIFYLLDGEATVVCGDEIFNLRAGDLAFLPRGIPHTPRVTSDTAKSLLFITPAGFEKYFEELSAPASALELPPLSPTVEYDPVVMVEVAARYGVKLLPSNQ